MSTAAGGPDAGHAEDHTGWDAVTKPAADGGLGFDARWQLAFYHDLIGDSDMAGDRARLLKQAGAGGHEPLRMDAFAGSLYATRYFVASDLLGIPDGEWQEIFNSDATLYGGRNIGNLGATRASGQGRLNVVIPSNGLVVLVRH